MALGEAALLSRQGDLAERTLERALQLSPEDADAHYLLGRARRLAGKPDQAKAELERAVQLAPSHMQAREALGSLLLDAGDHERAQGLFEALDREGAGTGATFGLIEALLAQLQLAAAEARLGKLDAESAASPAGQLLRARLAIAQGKAGDAAKLLQPLVAEDAETRTPELLVAYGDALFASEKVDSAAGAYDAALELDATHPDALVGRAMAAVRAEKAAEAVSLLARARTALDKRVRPPRLRAVLLLTWAKADILASSFESARQKLVEVTAMPSAPAEAHFWLGETLAKAKTAAASDSYAKYLELEPNGYYAARARRALAPR
jgi:tetratricopeptide (TPR) repeat protein